jgi:hypothetical protein
MPDPVMTKRAALAALLAAALVLGGGAALVAAKFTSKSAAPTRTGTPAFTEVKWPFPMDQWGLGKAYRCGPEDCGAEVNVYIRAKIGFCNCQTGVSDDAELERVGDVELFGQQFSAPGAGHAIAVAWMKGRSRAYDVPGRAPASTLAIAFNDRCDVIVATAVVSDGPAARTEPAVLAFLNSDTVVHWAEKVLGL